MTRVTDLPRAKLDLFLDWERGLGIGLDTGSARDLLRSRAAVDRALVRLGRAQDFDEEDDAVGSQTLRPHLHLAALVRSLRQELNEAFCGQAQTLRPIRGLGDLQRELARVRRQNWTPLHEVVEGARHGGHHVDDAASPVLRS